MVKFRNTIQWDNEFVKICSVSFNVLIIAEQGCVSWEERLASLCSRSHVGPSATSMLCIVYHYNYIQLFVRVTNGNNGECVGEFSHVFAFIVDDWDLYDARGTQLLCSGDPEIVCKNKVLIQDHQI